MLGGVAWERFAVDPYPGPRPLEQIAGGRPLGATALLADAETATPDGVRFCEAGMAEFLGEPTVLIDVTRGPAPVAEGVRAAAAELGCDLVIFADVGGDAIAHGSEPGLASPLCDAVMLAAAPLVGPGLPVLGAVFGAGCDAELTPEEVLARIAVFARADAWLGTWSMSRAIAEELVAAAGVVPTEASLQAARCALGETGEAQIRGGRRTVARPGGRAHLLPRPGGRAGMPAARRRGRKGGRPRAGPGGARRTRHPHRARLRTRPRRRSLKRV